MTQRKPPAAGIQPSPFGSAALRRVTEFAAACLTALLASAAVLSDLEAARLLLLAGRLGHAMAFLVQADPAGGKERLERHLLLGRVHMLLGNTEEAAESYEAALVIRPGITLVRLEATRANFLAGKDARARRHFRRAAEAGLPGNVEAAVARYLAVINGRRRWSARLSAALLPETNPVRRTGRETVEIAGIPFRLNEDAREASGLGLQIGFGGTFTPALAEGVRGHLSLSVTGKLYENPALNDISATGRIGLEQMRRRGPVSGGLQFGRRWAGGDGFQYRAGVWTHAENRLARHARTGIGTEFEYRKHDGGPGRDGWRTALGLSVRVSLERRTALVTDADIEWVDAKAEHHASLTAGLAATVTRAFGRNLSASGKVSMHRRIHRGPAPLFEKSRKERIFKIGGRLHSGAWRAVGFFPIWDIPMR